MGFTIVEGFFVSYHTEENPSDSEWRDQSCSTATAGMPN